MKKILFTLLISLCLFPSVKAEEDTTSQDYANNVYNANEELISNMYNNLMETYKSYQSANPYYHVFYHYANLDSNYKVYDNSQSYIHGYLYYFNSNDISSDVGRIIISHSYNLIEETKGGPGYGAYSNLHHYKDFRNYDSNLNITLSDGTEPIYFINTIKNKYITVNLDNYEYVILNLKDYTKEDAFSTNFQVKGMIGITPVYEYGTIEKDVITDRCNLSYSDYTDHRLYILKNDLINNAVYYVKACEDNSSFKFDSSIFDITYVTADTVNDPVITVGGKEYHTIRFESLNNSANQNEDNNFIPGESEQFDPFSGIVDYISSFWNNLTIFMGLVTKFFNTLPIEIRAISITTFITGCTLGLIKIIKS